MGFQANMNGVDMTADHSGIRFSDELLGCIEEWAERLSACKAATTIPMPAALHVEGQNHTISLTLREMVAVLKNNGRDVPLGE